MSKITKINPVTAAIGSAFALTLAAAPVANAAENPFQMSELSSGYMVADSHMGAEGNCGGNKGEAEAKCGADKAATKDDAEGKCGGDKSATEGKCGGDKAAAPAAKSAEGKCGEAKCGGNK